MPEQPGRRRMSNVNVALATKRVREDGALTAGVTSGERSSAEGEEAIRMKVFTALNSCWQLRLFDVQMLRAFSRAFVHHGHSEIFTHGTPEIFAAGEETTKFCVVLAGKVECKSRSSGTSFIVRETGCFGGCLSSLSSRLAAPRRNAPSKTGTAVQKFAYKACTDSCVLTVPMSVIGKLVNDNPDVNEKTQHLFHEYQLQNRATAKAQDIPKMLRAMKSYTPCLEGISGSALNLLAAKMTVFEFFPQEYVARQDCAADSFMLLFSGTLSLTTANERPQTLQSGTAIGDQLLAWICARDGAPQPVHEVTILGRSNAVCLVLTMEDCRTIADVAEKMISNGGADETLTTTRSRHRESLLSKFQNPGQRSSISNFTLLTSVKQFTSDLEAQEIERKAQEAREALKKESIMSDEEKQSKLLEECGGDHSLLQRMLSLEASRAKMTKACAGARLGSSQKMGQAQFQRHLAGSLKKRSIDNSALNCVAGNTHRNLYECMRDRLTWEPGICARISSIYKLSMEEDDHSHEKLEAVVKKFLCSGKKKYSEISFLFTFLEKCELWRKLCPGWDEERQRSFLSSMRWRLVEDGETVFNSAEERHVAYAVLKGEVHYIADETSETFEVHHAGSLIGEDAIFASGKKNASPAQQTSAKRYTAVAVGPVHMVALDNIAHLVSMDTRIPHWFRGGFAGCQVLSFSKDSVLDSPNSEDMLGLILHGSAVVMQHEPDDASTDTVRDKGEKWARVTQKIGKPVAGSPSEHGKQVALIGEMHFYGSLFTEGDKPQFSIVAKTRVDAIILSRASFLKCFQSDVVEMVKQAEWERNQRWCPQPVPQVAALTASRGDSSALQNTDGTSIGDVDLQPLRSRPRSTSITSPAATRHWTSLPSSLAGNPSYGSFANSGSSQSWTRGSGMAALPSISRPHTSSGVSGVRGTLR
jgi:CRP-like cAMP-binding protein